VSGMLLEPIRRDRLELDCIFVPDGSEDPQSGSTLGRNPLGLPCIFVPDDHGGQRLGYPWIEFGRMTLHRKPAADAPGRMRAREEIGNAPVLPAIRRPGAATGPTRAVSSPGSHAGDLSAHSPAQSASDPRRAPSVADADGYTSPDLTATMEAWNSLSDPRAILAALDVPASEMFSPLRRESAT